MNHTQSLLSRPMKFLPNASHTTFPVSSTQTLEEYIHNTKDELDNRLPTLFKNGKSNISKRHHNFLKTLKNQHHILIIKPVDKNLGIVLINTEDYVNQCLQHLTTLTYHLVSEYPSELHQQLENIIMSFKTDLTFNIINSKSFYHHLLPKSPFKYRTPQFYGLPKVHKDFENIPPVRPIISQSGTMFETTGKFLDYALQPIARSYPDYLHNSSALIGTLSKMSIPKDTILVSLDVISLYPSIPQQECLTTIHEE